MTFNYSNVYLNETSTISGHLEKEGNYGNYFDKSYFVEGQVLIDVGINRDDNGKLCGDICEDAKENMLLATPVPGGIGLLTRVKLLENTVEAYKFKGGI